MREFEMSLLAVVCAPWLAVATAAQPLEDRALDRLSVDSRLENGDLGVVQEIRNLPVEEADELLRELMDRYRPRNAEIYTALAQSLATLPGAPALYEKRLADLPHYHENSLMRGLWTSELGRIRARWSLNLLAKYLFDDRPLESKHDGIELELTISQLGGSTPNRRLAACAIGAMGLKNLPTSGNPILYTEKDEQRLRHWWRENEHRPDSFFFDGANSAPGANVGRPTSTLPSSAATTLTQGLSKQGLALTSEKSSSSWKWGILAIAAIATTLALWYVRRNSQR